MTTPATTTPPPAGTPPPAAAGTPAAAPVPAGSPGSGNQPPPAAAEGDKKGALTQAAGGETPPPAASGIELKAEGFKESKWLDGYKALAGEFGLDSAKAQKLFEHVNALDAERRAAGESAWQAADNKWAAELQSDPNIGGEKWKGSLQAAARGIAHFKAGPVVKVLEAAGLSNQPDIFRFFVALGSSVKEDSVAGTSSPTSGQPARKSLAEVFYGTPST